MAKAWITDLWVKDAVATLPDGSTSRLSPTAAQLRSIGKLPEMFRSSKFGRGKRWQVCWHELVGGERKQRARSFDTKGEAAAFAAELEDSIRSGKYLDPSLERLPFREVAEAWLQTKTDIKDVTWRRYMLDLQRYVLPRWGEVAVGDIRRRDIETWISELIAGKAAHRFVRGEPGGLSALTVRHIVRLTFGSVLGYAVEHKLIAASPLVGVRLPKRQASEVAGLPVLTVEQLEEAATLCGERGGRDQYRILILLLGYVGLRIGEATALRVGDVDLTARRISVRRTWTLDKDGRSKLGTPKTGSARLVPVPPFLVDDIAGLCRRRAASEFVFRGRGGAAVGGKNFYNRIWKPVRRELGIEHITVHDLRHTAASLAIKAGADVLIVQRMLGHADATETLNTYSHMFPDKLDEVMSKVERIREAGRCDSTPEGLGRAAASAR